MRLASVYVDGHPSAARVEGDRLTLLPEHDLGALISHSNWRTLASAAGPVIPASDASFRPVVPDPPKILCMGRNYAEHVLEGGHELPEFPTLFAKYTASLCDPYADILMPSVSIQLDWEAELAVVIGAGGRAIPRVSALGHVAGYTVSNDFSVRDWQNRTNQWHAGKAWDCLTPLGPYLVTEDELPPGATGLDITCEVDGVVMQKGNTTRFIFDVATIIADISTFTRLEPGDVILTGTPDGVGNARDPKIFLRPGQTVVSRVDKVGELRNNVVA